MQSSQPSSSRRALACPFLLTFLAMLAAVMLAALLPRSAQTSIIADLLLTTLILCPLALCAFPVYLLLVFMIIQLQRAHSAAESGLARLSRVSISLTDRVEQSSERWARRSIRFNAWFVGLDRLLFSAFDRPQRETASGRDSHDLQ